MPEATTESTTAQATTDESANNTGASTATGAATQTAQTEAQPTEKTFTQADVDRIVQNRLKSAVKAELKKLTGEGDGTPTVEDLQREKQTTEQRAYQAEARLEIRDFVIDPKNKVNARVENIRAIEKLVLAEIDYDDQGKPSNLKEAVERVRQEAPTLFVTNNGSFNGNAGNGGKAVPANMNDFIRQQHAGR